MIKIFIASFIAGSLQTIIGHPFDTMKTKIQLNHKKLNTPLYAGFFPALISGCFQNAYLFTSHNEIQKITNNHFISGFLSGLTSSLIITPLEYIKCNLQNKTNYKFCNMYNGLKLTIYRDSIGLGIYFYIYNNLDKKYGSFFSGGIAGLLSWIYSYPFDTIKTRIQTKNHRNNIMTDIKIRDLYKGFSLVAIRSILVNSFIFLTFDKITKLIN